MQMHQGLVRMTARMASHTRCSATSASFSPCFLLMALLEEQQQQQPPPPQQQQRKEEEEEEEEE